MSRACWIFCVSCTHRYCEFCFEGSKYEKRQNDIEDIEGEVDDDEECESES